MKFCWLAILFVWCMIPASVSLAAPMSTSPRERLLMDFNWKFTHGDPAEVGDSLDYVEGGRLDKTTTGDMNAETQRAATRPNPVATNLGGKISYVQPGFDAKGWRSVDLPHDWVVELGFDRTPHVNIASSTAGRFHAGHGFYDLDASKGTNIGWYRREFILPAADAGKTISIEFDGVYRNSMVWINGQCLGRYPSGYSSFSYDISKYVKPGQTNTLVVRVDASRFEGWFYEGAGIYRHVWMVKTDPVHVAKWGTFVTTEVDGADATLTVRTQLRNDGSRPATATLVTSVIDADGKSVAESDPIPLPLSESGKGQVIQKLTVRGAKLWSLETPYLYRVISTVKKENAVVDVYETAVGVRTLRWDVNEGFFLNGKHVIVKGTSNHPDHAGVGTAAPDRLNEHRIELLKGMGCNAYRCSHGPPTPELLDACDRLGMLVMDENRRMDTSPWAMEQLDALIRRDRNHPSIFIWTLGNEEMGIQGNASGAQIVKTMQEAAHKLDPSRLCTVAMNGAWGTGITTVIDVQGYNYLKNGGMDQTHQKFPKLPSVSTEESSTLTTRGEYENTRTGFQSAYDLNVPKWGSTAEESLQYMAARPFVAGTFIWTGFDYRGEPTPFSWPNTGSQFGIMDTCGFPKDAYYFYKAWWTDQPVLHLFPHWNWKGKEGQAIDVWAYSNCDEVELSLNGKSLGVQKMEKMSHVSWKVNYQPGTLVARGLKGGKEILTEKIETTGEAATVDLAPDRAMIRADGEDVSVITVSVRDAAGRIVPIAKNEITFAIKGGKIIGVGNGDPTSHESDQANHRKVFNGLAQVIVQATRSAGPIEFTATGDRLKPATITLSAQAATLRAAVP